MPIHRSLFPIGDRSPTGASQKPCGLFALALIAFITLLQAQLPARGFVAGLYATTAGKNHHDPDSPPHQAQKGPRQAASERVAARAEVSEISLDYFAWASSGEPEGSTFVTVGEDGSAVAVNYSVESLTVKSFHRGTLPAAEVARLFSNARSPVIRRELKRSKPYAAARADADTFSLAVRDARVTRRRAFSPGDKAPKAVFSLAGQLLALGKRLERRPAASGYLRSRPLTAEETAGIKVGGGDNLTHVGQLPPGLKTAVASALERPGSFLELSEEQRESFLARKGRRVVLYALYNDRGYELKLFSPDPPLPLTPSIRK